MPQKDQKVKIFRHTKSFFKRLNVSLVDPLTHHRRSLEERWNYPRNIYGKASCLMEGSPMTYTGDPPGFLEFSNSRNTSRLGWQSKDEMKEDCQNLSSSCQLSGNKVIKLLSCKRRILRV
jgi:hypothetical protein